MGKSMVIGLAKVSLIFGIPILIVSNACAQTRALRPDSRFPQACRFLVPNFATEKDDPEEERRYAESSNKFYHLWCASDSSSRQAREAAADEKAESWKKLWYRDDPFNAAFHETGSFDLLVLLGITQKLPRPLVASPEFMQDWLKDCSDRCFMIYGDDDPEAKQEWQRMMHLRDDVLVHLEREQAAKPVLTMLKNAKLYPVN